MLLFQFLGPNGDRLIEVGATFTQNQKFSIEDLNQRRRRDHKLDQFLSEQERRPECRRLQVHALLPAEHQRLVKYPLLLGQLAKQSEEAGEAELQTILKCVEKTREILESIDRRVAKAQNRHRLSEIQTNLDTSGLDKVPESPITQEYRVSTFISQGWLNVSPRAVASKGKWKLQHKEARSGTEREKVDRNLSPSLLAQLSPVSKGEFGTGFG